MDMPYVELHCHSGFSFLDGASHPQELAVRAVELGYPALALTDHNGLYGSMEFAHAAKRANLQPITGAEVTLRECFPGFEEPEHGHHVTLLAETPQGYANLCRLLTETHMGSERGDARLPLPSLLELSEGLILLTGCGKSPVAAALASSVAEAEQMTRRLADAFGPGSVFVELQDNAVKGDTARNKALARLAGRMGLGVVATGNVHYHRPERHRLQDVLVSIKDEDGNPRFSANEITGMFISLMFAGHHTSSGTSSWTLIELLRHPDYYAQVQQELDDLYGGVKNGLSLTA